MNRQRFKQNFGGGQRIISTNIEHNPNFIVKVLLNSAENGKSLLDVLTKFEGRDFNLASELLQNDPRLSAIKRSSNSSYKEEKPRVFNRTKMLKTKEEEKQKQEDELIRFKAILLKNKRSA